MKTTNLFRMIRAYLDNGGASMSEEEYQRYKLGILNNWLDKYFLITNGVEPFHDDQGLGWRERVEYTCLNCDEPIKDPDQCLTHLRIHHPEFFEGTKEQTKSKKARK